MSKVSDADWDVPIRKGRVGKTGPKQPVPAGPPTVSEAIESWLRFRAYSPSTARSTRHHLCGRRFTGWREREGIVTIDQLTAAKAAEYLLYLRDRGAAPGTLRKTKLLFQSLRAFCEETPGLEGVLQGDEIVKFRLPPMVQRIPRALTEAECLALIAACKGSLRDQLIVETLLLTGLRVSELCNVTLDALELHSRPAYLEVRGSVHNPERTKNHRERRVVIDYDHHGFGRGYVQRLSRYIEERPASPYSELFMSPKRLSRGPLPLTTNLEQASLMDLNSGWRLSSAVGLSLSLPMKLTSVPAACTTRSMAPEWPIGLRSGSSSAWPNANR